MATLDGVIRLTGGMEGLSYYKLRGSEKIFVRTKGGPSKKRMKDGAEFYLIRKHQAEWVGCVLFSKGVSLAMGGLKKLGDFNVSPFWNGMGKNIIKVDESHPIGERSLELTKCKHVLESFNLNKNFTFNAVCRTNIQFDLNTNQDLLTIKIPYINTDYDLYNVQKLPYFRLSFSLGMLSDLYFDARLIQTPYIPWVEDGLAYSKTIETDWLSAKDLIPECSLEIKLITPIPQSMKLHYTYLVCAAIEFGNVGFGGKVEAVKHASCSKIMMTAQV